MPPRLIVPLEALAKGELPTLDNVDQEDLDRIAHLALLIAQEDARKGGVLLPEALAVPYMDRPAPWRAANRATAARILQALILLGWIET